MENLQHESTRETRRKIVFGVVGFLALFPFLKFSLFKKDKKVISCAPDKPQTIKLLAQDGTLVEVEISKIGSSKGKIANQELMGWVKR